MPRGLPQQIILRSCALRPRWSRLLAGIVVIVFASFVCPTSDVLAQPQPGFVELNLQGNVKLDTLLQYLSNRLEVKYLVSEEVAKRNVVIRTPSAIPVESLPLLLGSVLRAENLAIVEADIPGWKRIVDISEMVTHAEMGEAADVLRRDGPATPVTQVFVLENINSTDFATVIRPFLSKTGSNVLGVPNSNVLVVTDYSSVVAKLTDLVKLIDRPPGETIYEFYEAKNQQSSTLAEQVGAILGTDTKTPRPAAKAPRAADVLLFDEPLGNRIVVAGEKTLVERAMMLLKQLDISLGMATKVYRLRNVTAERIDKIVTGFIAPKDTERTYQSTIDEDGNLLIVRATADMHRQIETLLRQLDKPVDSTESPIQFYKLKNARALDVLYSLLALQEAYGAGQTGQFGAFTGGFGPFGGQTGFGSASPFQSAYPGLQRTNSPLQQRFSPGVAPTGTQPNGGALSTMSLPLTPDGTAPGSPFLPQQTNPLAPTSQGGLGLGGGAGGVASLPGGARVSADISTNSLIVVAPTSVQPMYKNLIESLDQRRPQVLIEAKIVAIDTTDAFSLGVEVSVGDRTGDSRLFEFTSFGLSEVDPVSGALKIIPALGFNGTLVDPDVADVVVRALARHTRARVLAAPKILVNDNSTGKLESVVSIPFQSVNASDTVATTSLGGDQQAGTTITVTPHINEDDHLQLEFDVEFSTFQGATVDPTLPPPRQIDRVGSTVTIPDGQTVIVGGLQRIGGSAEFTGIPWLEHIPIIRELSSRKDESITQTSFFLFIRPIVLRDSRFNDLKFLSHQETNKAGISGEYPMSRPVVIP